MLIEPPEPKREAKPRHKNDPKYVKAARELRDRYLEQVNADRMLPAAHWKYDVSRQIGFTTDRGFAAAENTENTEGLMVKRLLDAA